MKKVYISPSRLLARQSCRKKDYYRYVLKIKSKTRSVALAFGSAIDSALSAYLMGRTGEPHKAFETVFHMEDVCGVEYGVRWSRDDMVETGIELCKRFVAQWERSGLVVAHDRNGVPLVQRDMNVLLGPGVQGLRKLDLIALHVETAKLRIIDLKTSAKEMLPGFSKKSPQLTDYDISVAAQDWGLPPVSELQFIELIKRKIPTRGGKGPEVIFHEPVPARSEAQKAAYLEEVNRQARDIRAGIFPEDPRMSFDTPCALCDYRGLCYDNSKEGLLIPAERDNALWANPQLPSGVAQKYVA